MPKRLWRKITSPTARTVGAIWILMFGVSGYTMWINYREANCDREFRAAIVERARVTEKQRQAIAAWIKDFATPPPEARQYGPARMVWLQGVSDRAAALFYQEQPTPLPDIQCGN